MYNETHVDIPSDDDPLHRYTLIKKAAHGSHIVTLVDVSGHGDDRTVDANCVRIRAPMERWADANSVRGDNIWRDIRSYPAVNVSMRSAATDSAPYSMEY